MLKILQINLNNCREVQELALQYLPERDIDFCAVSEPSWINNAPGWHSSLDGHSLVYGKTSFRMHPIRKKSIVALVGENLSILSCYISPNLNLLGFILFLEEVKSLIQQIKGSIILCGDFNAHSKFWGSHLDSRRGTLVLDYMAELELRLLNIGVAFTCNRFQGSSIIDLSWATADIVPLVHDWKVEENLASLSDHLYISFGILNKRPNAFKHIGSPIRWNFKKMKEEDFILSIDWHVYPSGG